MFSVPLFRMFFMVGLVLPVIGHAVESASRTVVLMPEQETALLYITEEANARRGCTMLACTTVDEKGQPLVPFTVDQALNQIVSADLANGLRNLDAGLVPVLDNLRALDIATLTKVLATVTSQATRDRIQQKLRP